MHIQLILIQILTLSGWTFGFDAFLDFPFKEALLMLQNTENQRKKNIIINFFQLYTEFAGIF